MTRSTVCALVIAAIAIAAAAPFAGKAIHRFGARHASGDRVAAARASKGAFVKQLVRNAGLPYPPKALYIRAFKREKQMELWGAESTGSPYKLIQTYTIARMSGDVGPKRKSGDYQVPEGFYTINRYNPLSSYHLSLGLNYPNESDRILSDKREPGGDIFIHGNNVSIGCMAMTDDKIDEIYLLAWDTHQAGQKNIPVHVFPCRMGDMEFAALLGGAKDKYMSEFWKSLKPAYTLFEMHRKLPEIKVKPNGRYVVGL